MSSAPMHSPATSNGSSPSSSSLKPGIYVPTIAFFNDDESLDLTTTAKHAINLARAGVAGLVTHGSNGEAVHLSPTERSQITQATRDALDSSGFPTLPVIAGCGAQSTRETIALCTDAAASGAGYALVLPPSYYASLLTSELILTHLRAVADASPIPLIIYNFPGATSGYDMGSDQIIALSSHPKIVGVKLTCGNTGKLTRVAAEAPQGFLTMGGSADFILQTLVAGGHGVIGGLANMAPKACVKTMALYMTGKVEEAQACQKIVARGDWVAIKGGFVAVKVGLAKYRGYGGKPRAPCALPVKEALTAMTSEFAELMDFEGTL